MIKINHILSSLQKSSKVTQLIKPIQLKEKRNTIYLSSRLVQQTLEPIKTISNGKQIVRGTHHCNIITRLDQLYLEHPCTLYNIWTSISCCARKLSESVLVSGGGVGLLHCELLVMLISVEYIISLTDCID